jgi:hypothetical protein
VVKRPPRALRPRADDGGAPDSRWNDSELNTLKALKGSDFEVVKMGAVVTQ